MFLRRVLHELKDFLVVILVFAILLIIVISAINLYVVAFASALISDLEQPLPMDNYRSVAVFDSGIWSNSDRDLILDERLQAAYQIYESGKADTLYLSGHTLNDKSGEDDTLYTHAVELGFSADDIIIDYASMSPMESAERAKDVFGINTMVIVSQRMGLYRQVYDTKKAGVNIAGVNINSAEVKRPGDIWINFREFLRRSRDFLDLLFDFR